MRTALKQRGGNKSKFSYDQAVQALDYKTRDKVQASFQDLLIKGGFVLPLN
jgi:hypothetical protein